MKKIILPLLLLAIAPKAIAQCQAPTILPYLENMESTAAPAVPECMVTSWDSFASQEVFETVQGPIPGFTGRVLAYDTTVNTEFGMPANAPVRSSLITPPFEMVQGTAYKVSFRYANSDAGSAIGSLGIYMASAEGAYVELDVIENITGAVATDYISAEFTPPATGVYYIDFSATSGGTQGLLYMDDIEIQAFGVMSTDDNAITQVTLFPNPANDRVNIQSTLPVDSIVLYNISGQLVLSHKPETSSPSINISALPVGLYMAYITSGSKTQVTKLVRN